MNNRRHGYSDGRKSSDSYFQFLTKSTMTTIKKPILILEDTDHVNASYVRAITKAGYTPKVHYGCDLDYDLRDFDAVFVDRDNAKLSDPDDIEGNIIFHTYLIKLFNATITKKRPYESWRIFPASEDSIGNTYLVDALTSIAEKK